jgi:Zn-finger protein
LEQCGGKGKYVNGIKDCSACLIPHSKNAHEYIVGKIVEVNKTKRK